MHQNVQRNDCSLIKLPSSLVSNHINKNPLTKEIKREIQSLPAKILMEKYCAI